MELNIINLLDLKYTVCVILGSYGIISFVIKNPDAAHKHIITFSWGVALATIWYYLMHTAIDTLILSFIIAVIGYDKLLNPILDKLGISYDDHKDKGIV